jgi:peptide/nickel transport system substrate-binding protein
MNGTCRAPRTLTYVLLLAVAGSACGDAPPRRGGTVVVAAGSDLDYANPLVSVDRWTNEVLRYALFTPLVRYGPELEYEPALAESWETDGDSVITFHLRRDLPWHDGELTTAEDVVFTFERATDPETGFPNAGYFSRWSSAEAVDSFTVRFRLEPHPDPLAGWPFTPIVPKHALDSIPSGELRQAAFNHRPVGNGPFRFVSHRSGDRWILEANPSYPEGLGGRPLLDRFVWRVIPENAAQATELQAGEADLVLQPRPEDVDRLAERDGIRAALVPSRDFNFVAWNGQRAPLDRAVVRRALAMGIDRQGILEGIRRGYGRLASGPIMPFHWSFSDEIRPLPFDPDSARTLLASAGIEDRDGDGVLELDDGSELAIQLKFVAASDVNRDLAEAVRADLAELGVRASTRPTEYNTLVADVTSPDRRFDAALLAWSGDFRLDLHDIFHSRALDGPYQFASYSSAVADSLLDRAGGEADRAVATPIWRRLQRVLRDDQPWTLLYYRTDPILARERVRGMDMDIRGMLVTVPDWWVEGPSGPGSGGAASDDSGG